MHGNSFFFFLKFLIGLGSFTTPEVCAGGALLAFFHVLYCKTHRKDLGQGGLGWLCGTGTHGESQKFEGKMSFLHHPEVKQTT